MKFFQTSKRNIMGLFLHCGNSVLNKKVTHNVFQTPSKRYSAVCSLNNAELQFQLNMAPSISIKVKIACDYFILCVECRSGSPSLQEIQLKL